MSICILGAGIMGLSTATIIQKLEPRAKVTLLADRFSPDVTSSVAAGFLRPYLLADMKTEQIHNWYKETFDYVEELAYRQPEMGAIWQSGYDLSRNQSNAEKPFWSDIVRNYRNVGQNELEKLGLHEFLSGCFYTNLALENRIYLPKLMEIFVGNGGRVERQKLQSLDDLPTNFDAVCNCTGLGARRLFADSTLFPVRGQVLRVEAPNVKHFFVFDSQYYVFQNSTSIILGGTKQRNDWGTDLRTSDSNDILESTSRYLPALKTAKVLQTFAALRPCRTSVRLEVEKLHIGGKITTMVHNYGHGGAGITLFRGCASDSAKMLKMAIHKPNAKL